MPASRSRSSRTARKVRAGLAAAVLLGLAAAARGDDLVHPPAWSDLFRSSSVTLYTENDKYFAGTDRHYTNGFKLSFLGETNLNQSPGFVQAVADYIPTLTRQAAARQDYKVGVSLGQNIYTPTQIHTPVPDPADRPYAAWLYGALTFQAEDRTPGRTHDLLRVVEISFGVVGPSALGETIQNHWHDLIHVPHAEGWAHQLHDEPGLVLAWERRYRVWHTVAPRDGFGADLLGRYGLSLGNVDTSARAGFTARLGWKLPADFGPDLIRAAGGDTAPVHRSSVYFFGSAEARAVGRNIFLDGNTWRASASVDKRPVVADANVGLVIRFPLHLGWMRGLQVAYTQNYRTKEFYGQLQRDVFGSIAVTVLH